MARISDYQSALKYLYDNLPVFQRIGAAAYKRDLHNTIALCEALGHPETKFKSVHIAGTNGKGSTSHMIASILQTAGYRTGLYTSPHLKSFTERIRINGQEISEDFVVDFVNRIRPVSEKIQPSFFEMTVAMAFDYFAHYHVDIAVIEVGLGGRLDSTNVIQPELSVITNIGWDHKDLLGDTLEMIASEKAGIIKHGAPVIVSERQSTVEHVFQRKASEAGSAVTFASDEWTAEISSHYGSLNVKRNGVTVFNELKLPLLGFYQKKNVCGVLAAIASLQKQGYKIDREHIVTGLEDVVRNTGLKGRWQVLQQRPLIICDTGHNIDGVREVLTQISTLKFRKLHMVWGMVKDKDVSEILKILPRDARYYFCQASIPRALDASILHQNAASFGLQGEVIPQVSLAIATARANASPDDVIFIGGSTFVVAEIEEL